MVWVVQVDDDFNRANGAPGNGWTDPVGSIWNISSNKLITNSNSTFTRPLARSEVGQDQRLECYFGSQKINMLALRRQSDNACYVGYLNSTTLYIARLAAFTTGQAGLPGTTTLTQKNISLGGAAITDVKMIFSAVGVNPTTLTLALERVSTGTAIDSVSITDSTASYQSSTLSAALMEYLGADYDRAAYSIFSTATAYTVTGPSSGQLNQASTNFTVTGSNLGASPVTVTPSDGSGGGTFNPTSVQISSGTPTATFTYTPVSAGAKTISFTNNGGLANPANLTYTPSVPEQTALISDTRLVLSPYNWVSGVTNNPGAYVKVRWTGTYLNAAVITTHLTGSSASAFPRLRIITDNGKPSSVLLTDGQTTQAIASGLTNTAHDTIIYLQEVDFNLNRWAANPPVSTLRISSFATDGSFSQATSKTKYAIFFGDSITEGVAIASTGVVDDGSATWAAFLAQAIGCEYGIVGFGSQGWSNGGAGGVPAFTTSWNLNWTGVNRSFTPQPDYLFVNQGTNGSTSAATVTSWLASVRTAIPLTKIFVLVPFGGMGRSALVSGVASANDPNVFLIDLGTEGEVGLTAFAVGASDYATDGIHPTKENSGRLAGLLFGKIQLYISPPKFNQIRIRRSK